VFSTYKDGSNLVQALLLLPKSDRIKFLSSNLMGTLKYTAQGRRVMLSDMIHTLPNSDKKHLGETQSGQTVLASLIRNFFDFTYAMSMVPEDEQIQFALKVAVHHPVIDRTPVINIYSGMSPEMGQQFIDVWFKSTKTMNPSEQKKFFSHPLVIDQLKTFKGSFEQLYKALLEISPDSDFNERILQEVFDPQELLASKTAYSTPKYK
jgi:hypothetical protein